MASFTQDVDRSRVLTAQAVMDRAVRGDEADDCGCETATPGTSFTDLCAISARVPHAVAVLDDGDLVGVVPRQRLIGFLGDEEADPGVCDSPKDQGGKVMAHA